MNSVVVAGLLLAVLVLSVLVVLIAIPATRRGGLIAAAVLTLMAVVVGFFKTSVRLSTLDRPGEQSVVLSPDSESRSDSVPVPMMPRLAVVGLGVLLLVGGAMLASNEKTRTVAMQIIATLGLVAAVVAVGAFFVTMPQDSPTFQHVPPNRTPVTKTMPASGDTHSSKTGGTARVDKPKTAEAEFVPPEHAPPLDQAPRPAWVDQPASQSNNEYRVHVASGLYKDRSDCEDSLNVAIKKTADRYLDSLEAGASRLVTVDVAALRGRLQPQDYWLEIDTARSVGPMLQLHALLKLENTDFQRKLREAHINSRLRYTASASLLVLAVIGAIFGYLKIDLATAGAHRARLQLAAAAAILIAAAGALAVRWSL